MSSRRSTGGTSANALHSAAGEIPQQLMCNFRTALEIHPRDSEMIDSAKEIHNQASVREYSRTKRPTRLEKNLGNNVKKFSV